jgi:hypothetical protein
MSKSSNHYPFRSLLLNAADADDQYVTVVRTKVAAVEWLFKQLGASEPQMLVDSNFVAWAAGLCLSPIWGHMNGAESALGEGVESSLTDLMATTFGAGIQVECGQKLVTFAVMLMKEISEHPERSPDCARTIEMMVDVLDNPGLDIKDTPKGRYLLSTSEFEAEANARMKVRLQGKSPKLAA